MVASPDALENERAVGHKTWTSGYQDLRKRSRRNCRGRRRERPECRHDIGGIPGRKGRQRRRRSRTVEGRAVIAVRAFDRHVGRGFVRTAVVSGNGFRQAGGQFRPFARAQPRGESEGYAGEGCQQSGEQMHGIKLHALTRTVNWLSGERAQTVDPRGFTSETTR